MNLLRANIRYQLPEHFRGGLTDALRDMLTYLEHPVYELPPHTTCFSMDHAGFNHNAGLGLRFQGETGIFHLVETKGWVEQDQGRLLRFVSPYDKKVWVR